jgi:hypothetical protein
MTFTSWQFGVFVAIVFAAYYLPTLRAVQVQLRPRARSFTRRFRIRSDGCPSKMNRSELRCADGVHLDERPAIIVTQAMERALASARARNAPVFAENVWNYRG